MLELSPVIKVGYIQPGAVFFQECFSMEWIGSMRMSCLPCKSKNVLSHCSMVVKHKVQTHNHFQSSFDVRFSVTLYI